MTCKFERLCVTLTLNIKSYLRSVWFWFSTDIDSCSSYLRVRVRYGSINSLEYRSYVLQANEDHTAGCRLIRRWKVCRPRPSGHKISDTSNSHWMQPKREGKECRPRPSGRRMPGPHLCSHRSSPAQPPASALPRFPAVPICPFASESGQEVYSSYARYYLMHGKHNGIHLHGIASLLRV